MLTSEVTFNEKLPKIKASILQMWMCSFTYAAHTINVTGDTIGLSKNLPIINQGFTQP